MNRRFRIKIDYVSLGEYSLNNGKNLILQVRVPYKCFGKTRYSYTSVFEILSIELPSFIITQKQIEEYLVSKFKDIRQNTKRERVIKRMEFKK